MNSPAHPYTRALFSASFDIKNRERSDRSLKGEIPSISNKPSGCYFHTRCPIAEDICQKQIPEEKSFSDGRKVACHFPLVS